MVHRLINPYKARLSLSILLIAILLLQCTKPESSGQQPPTWLRSDQGILSASTVTSMAVTDDNAIFVALYEPQGLYASDDWGEEWQWQGRNMAELTPLALLSQGDCLWVGTTHGLWLYRSGVWQHVEDVPGSPVYDMAGAPGGNTLVASEAGLFICSDEGCTRSDIGAPTLAVSASPNLACAGTADGLWCSHSPLISKPWQIAVGLINSLSLVASEKAIYISAGILHSCDLLDRECAVMEIPTDAPARVVRSQESLLVVGTAGGGIFVSDSSGQDWVALEEWNDWPEITAIQPISGHTTLVGTLHNGLYRFEIDKMSWERLISLPGHKQIHALLADGAGAIYAGGATGLYVSDDGGRSWRRLCSDCGSVQALAMAPDNSHLLAGTEEGVYRLSLPGEKCTLLTADLGRQVIFSLALDPFDPARQYAGCWGNNILASRDGGMSWEPVHSGLETLSVHSLAISPQIPGLIYAGTVEGVYRTTDHGQSWQSTNEGMRDKLSILALALANTNACVVYAGATDGLYKSSDCGETWVHVGAGLPPSTVNTCLLSENENTLLIGTEGNGVWLSRDGGNSWLAYGLQDQSVYSLLQIDDNLLLAATNEGVFRTQLPERV